MPFDTTTQTSPEGLNRFSRDHDLTADAARSQGETLVPDQVKARRERYAALMLAHNVGNTGATFPEQSPQEAEAERRDRYNDRGGDVGGRRRGVANERWAQLSRAGR